jgi:polysaccharide chain length determinant protein (PEP-CTERM system associated)
MMRKYTSDDITQIFVKRRWLLLVPFAIGLALAPFLSTLVAEKYRSEALILVVPQRVPDAYVKATITDTVKDRLPSITEQILSRSRLEAIITDMNLYPERRRRQVMEDVVGAMRNDVDVIPIGDRDSTDSFRVTYESDNANTARIVTQRLASLYIDENLKERENQADSTSQFLDTQLQEAKQRLLEQEKKLEEYRHLHAGELPTQVQGNLQGIQNANMQLQALNESMNRAQEKRLLIERQIADTEAIPVVPSVVLGPAGTATVGATTAQQLDIARARLNALLQVFTPEHYEVVAIRRLIGDLEAKLASEAPVSEGEVGPPPPLSAAEAAQRKKIADLRAEMLVLDKQLETSRSEAARLRGTIAGLQTKVDALPSRESELVELTRDYSTLQEAYSSLLMKREDSAIAANMERRQIGEQFRILDAASMPGKPVNQNVRIAVTASGALLGLTLGLFAILVLEVRDSSFRREEDVMAKLSLPVLALIPVMQSPRERHVVSRRQRWIDLAGAAVLLAAVGALVVWRLQS